MPSLIAALVALLALEHVWFLVLESFLWTKPLGLKIFGQTLEQAQATAVLAANQGFYNGILAAGLIWSLVTPDPALARSLQIFFLLAIAGAGIVGGLTASRAILFVQALPAMITLALVLVNR